LYIGAIQAGFFGIVLLFTEFYYRWDWINLEIPSPALYADVSSAFLIVMSIWTFYVAYSMDTNLWIILAGSAFGRIVYFFIALNGFLIESNEFLYVLIGITDCIIGLSLVYVTIQFKKSISG
jgi:hypothetical protein